MSILNIIEINILYNILYFIIIILTIGYILYIQNIIYISMILIIVYSTALVILLGFVIMKNKSNYPLSFSFSSYIILPFLFFLFSYLIIYGGEDIAYSRISTTIETIETDKIKKIGEIIYNDRIYRIIVIISAIILLTPIFALIYLCP